MAAYGAIRPEPLEAGAARLRAVQSGTARPAAAADTIKIPFERYTLPNGLTVILSEDHSTPTVAVNMWYHVGSKNEVVGRTGFAHLFEHVMFTGSGHVPYGLHDKLTEGVGGQNNGTTSNDRTTYFETVPSNYLQSALWIESDRMGFLLDTLDIAKLNAQRDIVKNERRQAVDNQPYGRASEILAAATYPPSHPYSWDVIGSMADLSAASEEDVKNFFRLYYAPNNTYLAIVGDFEPAQAKSWVSRYFGDLPKGKPITRPSIAPVTLDAEKRLVYEDRVQIPRLYVQWPTVGEKNDDQYALEILGAILTGPRTARLTKALVYDEQAAASVQVRQGSNEDVGELLLVITPRPGHTLTELEEKADAVIEKLKAEGPTAEEIQKATAGQELTFLSSLQSNLGKAFRLSDAAGFHGDPGYFKADYEKTLAVTAGDVKRVVNKYLTKGRVVLSIVPTGKTDLASRPAESRKITHDAATSPTAPASTPNVASQPQPGFVPATSGAAGSETQGAGGATTLDRTKVPPPGKPPALRVPTWTKATLANGAELIVSQKHDLPLVSFSVTFMGGANQYEPTGRRGLAGLTAAMMSEGTASRNGEALSNALQMLGTSISTSIGAESGSITFLATKAKFSPTLDILADELLHSTFPADALERLRAQRLVQLTQAKDQTRAIAADVFPRVLYGADHPLGQFTTEESVKAITRDEVVALQKNYFQPGRALITVVGDIEPAMARATVEKALAAWPKSGDRPSFTYPEVPAPRQTTIYLVDKPGATQSTFAIGIAGPPRNTPDYFALQVMNTILGGMFQSRLNANIREEKGYSYGVNSYFAYGKGPGPFRAGGDIVTNKTDAALGEFMKELRGIGGPRPITDEELKTAKDSLIQRLPGQFASIQSINGAITSLWLDNLPDTYYQQYQEAVARISKDDLLRVAQKYIDVDRLALVIVGDRATIEVPLKATSIAPIVLLDIQGNPVK